MPLWRCPHCGTPQVESSRCWVCRRSTTACGTCRHFQRGVAGGLGLCGLNPRRVALEGTEIRACWVAPDAQPEAVATPSAGVPAPAGTGTPAPDERRPRTFVPVEDLTAARAAPATASHAAAAPRRAEAEAAANHPAATVPPAGWSLWGDLDA